MIGPNAKRRWWVLGMVAALVLVGSALGSGRPALVPAVAAAQPPAERLAVVGEAAPAAASTGPLLRSLAFPAYSLARDPAQTVITQAYSGLRWKFLTREAYLIIPRPPDWDGTSAVQIRIFLRPTTSTPGTVQFFVRPRTYNPGDSFLDTTGVNSEVLTVSDSNKFYQLTISIAATRFGTKSWWYLVFQRTVGTPTYLDDVDVLSVTVDYAALSPLTSVALPVVTNQH